MSSIQVSQGDSITITVRAHSIPPVDWLDKSLNGPRGNIYGGGGSTKFQETEKNIWLLEWKETFSEWDPTGEYVLSNLRVRNKAHLQSEYWPEIKFNVIPKQET